MSESTDNYLKHLFALSQHNQAGISTSALAQKLDTRAASVTGMLKKLHRDGLVLHTRYKGTVLTARGRRIAAAIVRRHRIWECFLADHLGFGWDKVHDMAEKLEHVQSEELIDRLDQLLGFPTVDPHGDPIPGKDGKLPAASGQLALSETRPGDRVIIRGARSESPDFLQHLSSIGATPGVALWVKQVLPFDRSVVVRIKNNLHTLSAVAAAALVVSKNRMP